jgi:hypothetical protein
MPQLTLVLSEKSWRAKFEAVHANWMNTAFELDAMRAKNARLEQLVQDQAYLLRVAERALLRAKVTRRPPLWRRALRLFRSNK